MKSLCGNYFIGSGSLDQFRKSYLSKQNSSLLKVADSVNNLGQVSLNIFSRTKDVHGLPPLFNVGADTMLKGGQNHTSLVLSITNPPLHHFHAPFAIIFATRVTREAQKTLKIKHDIRIRTAARRQPKAKGGQMHMYMVDALSLIHI